MSTVFVRHEVADFDTWKPGLEEHGLELLESGDLKDAMSRPGVVSAPDVWIADEA